MESPATAALALYQQARELHARGELPAARLLYEQARKQLPDHPDLLQDLARLCARTGDLDTAATLLARVVELRPDSGLAGVLGIYLANQGRDAEATPHLRKHLLTHPEDGKAWLLLAQCLLHQKHWQTALQCAAEADRIAPSVRALDIALLCLSSLGEFEEFETCLTEALRRYPESRELRAHQGVHLHRQGRIVEGLRLQPLIRKRFSPKRRGDRRIASRQWDGALFDGVVLVSAEQGLGEEILASSFFRKLIELGQRAVIECDPRLIPVFTRSFPLLAFVPPDRDNEKRLASDGTIVRRIKTLDLAPLIAAEGEFTQPARWLQDDLERTAAIRDRYRQLWPGKRLVGISWRSIREVHGEQWKSFPLETFRPVMELPDVILVDVQYGGTEEERQIPVRFGLPPLYRDPEIDPMQDLDGLLSQLCVLDSLVTISNTTAHIAGAAGLPGHVVLPTRPPVYVYWGYDSERTPMYPSLHLWRPQKYESPEALASHLAQHLAGLFERNRGGQ